VKTVVPFCFII
jgi:hypothetical protein